MFSAPAQLALAFQKYSCARALLAKIAALNHFLTPLTCARKDPPHADPPAGMEKGVIPPSLPRSREPQRREAAGEQQKLPARHKQQPWKAQEKREHNWKLRGRNRTEKMGCPVPGSCPLSHEPPSFGDACVAAGLRGKSCQRGAGKFYFV